MHFHTQADQLKLLRRARTCLAKGGRLAIDLPNAGEAFGAMDNESVTLERTFLEQETGHLVMQQSVSHLDRTEQLMNVTWIYDEISEEGVVKRTLVPVTVRYFFLNELDLLLQAAGLALDEVFGDFDRYPYLDGCPRMFVVAK
jgi:hypothetical protein